MRVQTYVWRDDDWGSLRCGTSRAAASRWASDGLQSVF